MIYGVGKVNHKLTILDSMYASSSSPAKASLVSCTAKHILQEVVQEFFFHFILLNNLEIKPL